MKTFLAMARRELGVYFVSPMAYIILTVLLVLSSQVFLSTIQAASANQLPVDYRSTLGWLMMILVITTPLVTMRLIAEEKKQGTLEIILTSPISDTSFVLAKFAAAMVLLAYLLVLTVGYLVIISRYGPVDAGAALCGYLGLFLVGGVLYSIGLFVSSLCTSQITAGVLTFCISVLLIMAAFIAPQLPDTSPLRPVLAYIDLNVNFSDFLKGVVDRTRLVYLLSVILFFLFLTTRVVESRRWR